MDLKQVSFGYHLNSIDRPKVKVWRNHQDFIESSLDGELSSTKFVKVSSGSCASFPAHTIKMIVIGLDYIPMLIRNLSDIHSASAVAADDNSLVVFDAS